MFERPSGAYTIAAARPTSRRRRWRRVGELARDDQRPQGVADRNQADLAHGPEIASRDVEADQHRHADEADDKTEQAAGVEAVAAAGQPAEDDPDERSRGDQKGGQGARQAQLGVADEEPWQRDLDRRVHDDPFPMTQRGPEAAASQGNGHEDQRADEGAAEDEGHGADVVNRDLDEQVRDAPDEAHGDEQSPTAPAHSPLRRARQRRNTRVARATEEV